MPLSVCSSTFIGYIRIGEGGKCVIVVTGA